AEDGIRDLYVTGVQTCALPISRLPGHAGCPLFWTGCAGKQTVPPLSWPPKAGYAAGMYEHFEHTADLGLRVRAPDLNTLFAEAAEALFAAIIDDLADVEPREPLKVRVSGMDRAYLLFDWLKELLYRFDAEHRLFSRFEVEV